MEDFALADAIRLAFDASPASGVVVGGIHRGRVPAEVEKPYAVLKIAPAEGGIELSSPGSDSMAEYTDSRLVSIEVFANGQEAAAFAASEAAVVFEDEAALVVRGGTVLSILPQPSMGELQPELTDGEDVWKATVAALVMTEFNQRVPA